MDPLAPIAHPVEDTAALRREAAELLSRSRWWRDDGLRELLLGRRWCGMPSALPGAEPGERDRPGSSGRQAGR
ncbi:MAG: hypothetical protein QOJ82_3011 [Solirubrobacteraceae bacterium]|jgi:hypothetical protein|nr:hypothetical protein [Solirubrobacteraceae bacterium]MEA2395120.1 hypothetical protein [Solirubrobacteraceae bacterium]